MEKATGYEIYEEDGQIIFEDNNEKCILSEDIRGQEIYWDENNGYILADGRNITDLIK